MLENAMLNAVDSYSGYGAMGAAFGKSREQRIADRVDAVRSAGGVENREDIETKVRGVAEEFVSVFMNQVMKSMRSTVQENPEMHGDNGEKFFQEMLDSEQSKTLSKGSGYGLTDLVYQALMANVQVQGSEAGAESDPEAGTAEAAETPETAEARVG